MPPNWPKSSPKGAVRSGQERPFMVGAPPDRRHKHLPLTHPLWLVGHSAAVLSTQVPSQREFVQADVLDGGPDDRQATGLRGEHINLIGALPHIAEQTFNRIGGLNVPMHRGRKLVKRQRLLFLLG